MKRLSKSLFIILLALPGCAGLLTGIDTGDKNLLKNETKEQKLDANVQGSAQVGLNNTTMNTKTTKEIANKGDNSVFNDPAMLEKMTYVLGAALGLPSVLIILSFMFIFFAVMGVFCVVLYKGISMLQNLVNNVSDSLDIVLKKIDNDKV
jgi:hypothetical protein